MLIGLSYASSLTKYETNIVRLFKCHDHSVELSLDVLSCAELRWVWLSRIELSLVNFSWVQFSLVELSRIELG